MPRKQHIPCASVCDMSLVDTLCTPRLAAMQVVIYTLQDSLHALQFCSVPCIASQPNIYTAWLCVILQGKLDEERRARKQQGESADLAHKALLDRQGQLDQRTTAAEAASHKGKQGPGNVADMLSDIRLDIFHST